MNIYVAGDFREVIRTKIEENREIRGYRARLAEAAGCQRSFLSHVLNSHVLLTPDHALNLANFWNLNPDETDYFLHLVNLSRAQGENSRRYFETKLREIRQRNEDLAQRLGKRSPRLPADKEGAYYSSWYWSAVHIATSIPKFRTPQAIAQKLALPLGLVQATLQELQRMGLVTQNGSRWTIGKNHLHLPKASPFTGMNHANWRQKTVSRIQSGDLTGLHYSVIYGISQSDAEKIRQSLFEAFDRIKKVVEPSPEEELYFLGCDFFNI